MIRVEHLDSRGVVLDLVDRKRPLARPNTITIDEWEEFWKRARGDDEDEEDQLRERAGHFIAVVDDSLDDIEAKVHALRAALEETGDWEEPLEAVKDAITKAQEFDADAIIRDLDHE